MSPKRTNKARKGRLCYAVSTKTTSWSQAALLGSSPGRPLWTEAGGQRQGSGKAHKPERIVPAALVYRKASGKNGRAERIVPAALVYRKASGKNVFAWTAGA